MEGLGSLLLFAALFYFMMRFGCGAHMVHGHGGGRGEHSGHGGHGGHERGPAARDPVCGMDVKEETSVRGEKAGAKWVRINWLSGFWWGNEDIEVNARWLTIGSKQ